MKAGIFSPYYQTFGGGERYVLTVAEYLLKNSHSVDILGAQNFNTAQVKDRFDLDLTGARFCPDIFFNNTGLLSRLWKTTKYNLIFFLSDGSVPLLLGRKNILHFQVPFNFSGQKNYLNKIKLQAISEVVCNSQFTKKFIDKTYGIESKVIYPPVDIEKFRAQKKENIILSVGRFFSLSNPKKQDVLIGLFKSLSEKSKSNWKLILAGGVEENSKTFVEDLKLMSGSHNIEFITDANFKEIKDLYGRAKIYWHAAGFGEDLENSPEKAEHFGITTVEAMAAGCVPVVFGAGGQLEIISENKDGFFWTDNVELIKKTNLLMSDSNLLSNLSKQAVNKSRYFSKQRFFDNLTELIK